MPRDRGKGNGRRTKMEELTGRPEEDKRKARNEALESADFLNTENFEKGEEYIKSHDARDNTKTVGDKLDKAIQASKEKTEEIKKVGEIIKKQVMGGSKRIDETKLELTRKEMEDMGIVIKSDIAFGKYSKLTDEQKSLFDKELSGALLDKGLKIINSCFSEEKLASASLKDSAIALGIIFDKMRQLEGKDNNKTIKVEHSLTTLIQKNSNTKMTDIDFGDIIDIDPIEDGDDAPEDNL